LYSFCIFSKTFRAIDASAWDDIIQKDTLYLCVNKKYEFNFRAKDVIHSAHFPHFRAQMNTVPGMTTRFKFTPDMTTKQMREKKKDDKFQFILLCNKICGAAHYKMKMIVVVLPQNEYKAWMKSKAKQTFRDKFFAVATQVDNSFCSLILCSSMQSVISH
jgi:cytochrome c oxidase subunit 2